MKNNKGFSLVELIIVIAIMAILAAAIAPALIRYINKARKADDLTAAGEIVSAANTAMTNEEANDEIMNAASKTGDLASIATIDKSGVTASKYKSFEAEMKKTLPNGAAKKYVKDKSNGYILELSKDQFVVYAATGTTKKDMLNPKAEGEYAE